MTYNPEWMSVDFAVFNLHRNNAGKRANKLFITKYGRTEFNKTMMPFHRKGIMSIFDSRPTRRTKMWVNAVHRFVNEGVPKPAHPQANGEE